MLYDLSPPITPSLPVWPGDSPITREVMLDLAKGDTVTLSTLRTTVHLGSHADGPNHYGLGAPSVGEMPLEHYLGPCAVIDAPVARNSRVTIADLRTNINDIVDRRVLIRTGTFDDPQRWNSDFAGLTPELIHALAVRGVITIGLDSPSVDLQDSKDLPAHKAILSHHIAILEGLMLRDVPRGRYELIALPLKLMGFDGSPVRAVLRTLP